MTGYRSISDKTADKKIYGMSFIDYKITNIT